MMIRKQATLVRFEGKYASLLLENNQEMLILKEELPTGASEGDAYVVQILPSAEASLSTEDLARTLLNQILNDDAPPKKTELSATSGNGSPA